MTTNSNNEKRTAGSAPIAMPGGPFVARVVNHLDPRRSGALKVQLLRNATSGEDINEDGQLYTVRYCSPFYGVTDVNSNSQNNRYSSSQQSYGFWAVPPDPGTKVLVIFAEGKSNQGFWIGCIQDEFMNQMVPGGYAAAKSQFVVQDELSNNLKNKPLPTGEYNKTFRNRGNDPDKFLRPANPLMVDTLNLQGLISDTIRGLTSTTSRRETPSNVYGWNTPGPLDTRVGAPRGKYGANKESIDYYRSRLGGQAFTMDDGDPTILRTGNARDSGATYYDVSAIPDGVFKVDKTIPFNEHVRLKTRTGHQILLHNTEDLIYIGNAKGSTWVELTSNGKIDIYADDSISIRSSNDINLHADRDLNYSAGRDINFTAGRDTHLKVSDNYNVKIGASSHFDVGIDYDEVIGIDKRVLVGGDQDIQIRGNDTKTVSKNYSLQVAIDGKIAVNGEFGSKVAGNYRQVVVGSYNLKTTGDNKFTSGAETQILSTGDNKFTTLANTNILSTINHKETAAQVHMNSASNVAAGAASADNIIDTFTAPVTDDEEDKTIDPAGTDLEVPVTTDADLADTSPWPYLPRRIPRREAWKEHENLNPTGHMPASTEALASAPPGMYDHQSPISGDRDLPTTTKFATPAIEQSYSPQVVVSGTASDIVGKLPSSTMSPQNAQGLFIETLIGEVGLDPATAYGNAPIGNAQAIASALAQVQAECGFIPRTENMNYTAAGLQEIYPNKYSSPSFARKVSLLGPATIANTIYQSEEGFTYRGRGMIMVAGKANYKKYGGNNLVSNPELLNDPFTAIGVAVKIIKEGGITWTSDDFNALAAQFKSAIGYRDTNGSEIARRIELAKGFYSHIILGFLRGSGASLFDVPATGETTIFENQTQVEGEPKKVIDLSQNDQI